MYFVDINFFYLEVTAHNGLSPPHLPRAQKG